MPVKPLLDVDAVVFDLDGTFYPHKVVKKAMIRFLFPRVLLLKRYNDARHSTAGCDFGSAAGLRAEHLRLASRGKKRVATRIALWLETHYYPALFRSIKSAASRPGFPELLKRLHVAGIKMAVVSDYGGVRERLLSLGIEPDLFTLLLGTEDQGLMKPAIRINALIQTALGIVPARTLMVGDRADSDQALAKAAGMPFLGICESEKNSGGEWHTWPALKAALEALL